MFKDSSLKGRSPLCNDYDLMREFAKQGLCSCGTTKLRSYSRLRGWKDISGIVCPNCPASICRRSLEFTNKVLKNKIYKLTSNKCDEVDWSLFDGKPTIRRKTRKMSSAKRPSSSAEAAIAQSASLEKSGR